MSTLQAATGDLLKSGDTEGQVGKYPTSSAHRGFSTVPMTGP